MATPQSGVGLPTADEEIASRISNALIIKNRSIVSLAEETGIAYNTLRRSLKGHRSLSFKEFGRIATVLEVQGMDLLPDELTNRASVDRRAA